MSFMRGISEAATFRLTASAMCAIVLMLALLLIERRVFAFPHRSLKSGGTELGLALDSQLATARGQRFTESLITPHLECSAQLSKPHTDAFTSSMHVVEARRSRLILETPLSAHWVSNVFGRLAAKEVGGRHIFLLLVFELCFFQLQSV